MLAFSIVKRPLSVTRIQVDTIFFVLRCRCAQHRHQRQPANGLVFPSAGYQLRILSRLSPIESTATKVGFSILQPS